MGDLRQHLIEDDRAQMRKTESCGQPEVFRRKDLKPQQYPQQEGGINRQVVHEPDRQPAEERPTQRVEKEGEPAVSFVTVNPDQNPSSRFRCPRHASHGALRVVKVMDHPDRKHDIEAVFEWQIIGARAQDVNRRVDSKVASRRGKRTLVYIDGNATPPAVSNDDKAADCTLNMAFSDFDDMINGKLDGMTAFMTGKLKIEGDMGVAMKLQSILR